MHTLRTPHGQFRGAPLSLDSRRITTSHTVRGLANYATYRKPSQRSTAFLDVASIDEKIIKISATS